MSARRSGLLVGLFQDPSTSGIENPDWHLRKIYDKYITNDINFLAYPIGGWSRYKWQPLENSKAPPITLVDAQMGSEQWQCWIAGCISKWIDPDAAEEWLSKLSVEALEKEFHHCAYLGVERIFIDLKHIRSPNLLEVINDYMRKKMTKFIICFVVPTCVEQLIDNISSATPAMDVWSIWADFRRECEDHLDRLAVCLKFCLDCDEEFTCSLYLDRWKAEPLWSIWMDSSLFTTTDTGNPELSSFHKSLFTTIGATADSVIFTSINPPSSDLILNSHIGAIRSLTNCLVNNSTPYASAPYVELSHDILQEPLQPLSHNLESVVYCMFEKDRVKYNLYQNAIAGALIDIRLKLLDSEHQIVIYVMGAGRGGLIQSAVDARVLVGRNNELFGGKMPELRIFAVEKNESACLSLNYFNSTKWSNSVAVLNCDMRDIGNYSRLNSVELPSPDIIVSELLGSFGDNELSPECLDGVTNFMNAETICIPRSYRSFVAPIQSTRLHPNHSFQSDVYSESRRGKLGRSQSELTFPTDCLYTVGLRNYCLLAEPQSCFRFQHPNFEQASNERDLKLEFQMSMPCEVVGFAGFFEACLYKNRCEEVLLSTVPGRQTSDMFSWFPAFLPSRKPIRCEDGDTVGLFISRKVDSDGVWYTWMMKHKDQFNNTETAHELQNKDGTSYYMKLY